MRCLQNLPLYPFYDHFLPELLHVDTGPRQTLVSSLIDGVSTLLSGKRETTPLSPLERVTIECTIEGVTSTLEVPDGGVFARPAGAGWAGL